MFEVTFTLLMVFIDSLYVLFSYIDKQGEIWTVSFSLTKGRLKKSTPNEVMALLCLECVDGTDPDDLDEHSKIDYETLVSQHKDSLYYSESDEEEIVEEGRAKICHQKENLEFLHKLQM
jgi:hypothetical protein